MSCQVIMQNAQQPPFVTSPAVIGQVVTITDDPTACGLVQPGYAVFIPNGYS